MSEDERQEAAEGPTAPDDVDYAPGRVVRRNDGANALSRAVNAPTELAEMADRDVSRQGSADRGGPSATLARISPSGTTTPSIAPVPAAPRVQTYSTG